MSELSDRELSPLCMTCGLVTMHVLQLVRADSVVSSSSTEKSELRDFIVGRSGLSSRTLISVLVPELREVCRNVNGRSELGDHPWDPDDFGRCYRALKLIPGGAERIDEVAKAYPAWAGLAANWTELTALYEEEEPSGRAPKLYKRMKELTR
jgi:hypothetical protein